MLFGEVAGSTGARAHHQDRDNLTSTSAATDTGRFFIGNSGTGSVTISAGAVVNSRIGIIGRNAGSVGTVVVTGAGSKWSNTNTLIGQSGTGSLTVQGGTRLPPAEVTLGVQTGSQGT